MTVTRQTKEQNHALREAMKQAIDKGVTSVAAIADHLDMSTNHFYMFLDARHKGISAEVAAKIWPLLGEPAPAPAVASTPVGAELDKAPSHANDLMHPAEVADLRAKLQVRLKRKHRGNVAALSRDVGMSQPGLARILKGAGTTQGTAAKLNRAIASNSPDAPATQAIERPPQAPAPLLPASSATGTASLEQILATVLGTTPRDRRPRDAAELVQRWAEDSIAFVLQQYAITRSASRAES